MCVCVCQVTWDEYGWAMVIPSLAIPQWELLTPYDFEGLFHPFFWDMSGHVFKFVGSYPMTRVSEVWDPAPKCH